MQLLQNQNDGGDSTSAVLGRGRTHWFLEDPDRVVDGERVVSGMNPDALAAYLHDSQASVDFEFPEFGVCGRLTRYGALRWTHMSALLRLEGASAQQLLACHVLLLGRERPVHSPCPGFDDVVVATLIRNDQQLSVQRLFTLLHERILSGA